MELDLESVIRELDRRISELKQARELLTGQPTPRRRGRPRKQDSRLGERIEEAGD